MLIEFLLLTFFILLPKVGVIDLSFLSLCLLLIIKILQSKVCFKLSKLHVLFLTGCLLLILLSLLSSIFNNFQFVSEFILKPLRLFLVFFVLCLMYGKYTAKANALLLSIVIASFVNALVVIFQYTLHYHFGIEKFLLNPDFSEAVITPYRKPGLMSGYPVAGLLSVLGIISLGAIDKHNKYMFVFKHIVFVVLLISLTITSRTALLIGIVVILALVLKSRSFSLFFKKCIALVFVASLSVPIVMSKYENSDVIKKTVDKSFVIFINMYKGNEVLDYSSKDLINNHYTLPNDNSVFVIGNSVSPKQNIVNSDVFFIRFLWGNGFLSPFLYCSLVFLLYISIATKVVEYKYSNKEFYLTLMLFTMVAASFKGSYFFSRVIGDVVVVYYFYLISLRDK